MALPCELVDEILCRLPVKPLLRFRCVSKGWCSLIDSTSFLKKHLKTTLDRNAGAESLFINSCGQKFYLADFESLDDGDDDDAVAVEINDPLKTLLHGAYFVGSADGLVCVSKNKMDEFSIFNPSTRKSKKIPSAPAEFPRSFHAPRTSRCGFGYDDVNDDYKVVKIAECYHQFRVIMVIVYSLKTNSWKRIQNVPSNTLFFGDWGMFASGALHWLAIKNLNASNIIVGFDLGLEQFKEVPFPVIKGPFDIFNTLSAVLSVVSDGGSLYVLENYPNSHMDMWRVNNHSGAENLWFKALSVEQHIILGSFRFLRPVAFSRSGESVLLEVDISVVDRAKLVWYDLRRKTVKNVKIRGIPHKFDSYAYTESSLCRGHHKRSQKRNSRREGKKYSAVFVVCNCISLAFIVLSAFGFGPL